MSEVRTVKKYPNRRLYDCLESRYITLEDLRQMVVAGIELKVVEKSTGKDLTTSVLFQVVADQEQSAGSLLGKDFLLQLIRTYGGCVGHAVRRYLEESLKLVTGQQAVTSMAEHGSNCGAAKSR